MRVYFHKRLDSYNWANPSEKQWMLSLQVDGVSVSETFKAEDEPDIDDAIPGDVLDMIEKRLDEYWISTSRDEQKKKIAGLREKIDDINNAWIDSRIVILNEQIEDLKSRKSES